jgi:hypothetical protein
MEQMIVEAREFHFYSTGDVPARRSGVTARRRGNPGLCFTSLAMTLW